MIVIKQTKSVLNKVLPDAVNPLSGTDTTTNSNPNVVSRSRAYSSSNHTNDLHRNGSLGRKNSISKSKSHSNHHQQHHPLRQEANAIVNKAKVTDQETKSREKDEVILHSKNSSFRQQELNSFEWLLICIIILLLFIMYMVT
ncbi:hypothetical protein CORT_0C03510 [Candida orthopsilosis Co 90-125]|uniref:Uncharacterized protein n=1 Tax=Candida orthopsilosis (strain 90-125) TaxID=1136231 RepID=H8X3T7_CANO9|nr:hypothetical protein CORT_0C03510 [Candida orthopsilosis Co 90-125]CCG25725.1 hypothetical protein CORT_0C03510 [Candida orthopsilosis Co 90-125]